MWSFHVHRLLFPVAAALAIVGAIPAPSHVVAQAASCEDFQYFEFAQAVYEDDPSSWSALDPDGDGIACPDLAPGVAPALWTNAIPTGATKVDLVRVVDGDTIVFDTPAGEDTIRIFMTDTPETKNPNDPVECFGAEATAYTRWLLEQGAGIYLERDITERDRYDRLLRYVWIDFGGGFIIQLNEAIVRSGHGIVVTYPPDVRYLDQLRAAQEFAIRHNLGLWAACGGADTPLGLAAPVPAPQRVAQQPAPAPPADSGGACDPSYPDLCLPSYPDLDCKEIPQRRFRVLPPDPHNFDGNHDGIGCESD
jgi:micrococcal nuclease